MAGVAAVATEYLISIFEPMVRPRQHANEAADATRSLGVGLHVVRQLVLAHGGTIEVRSSDG